MQERYGPHPVALFTDLRTVTVPLGQVAAMRVQYRTPGEYLGFDLLYEQGLRESEVVALEAADFVPAANPVSVSVTRKGRKHVMRYLDSETAAHLANHLDGRDSGPVFTNPTTGKPRDRRPRSTKTVGREVVADSGAGVGTERANRSNLVTDQDAVCPDGYDRWLFMTEGVVGVGTPQGVRMCHDVDWRYGVGAAEQ